RPHPARVRAARLPAAAQGCGRHARHARPGRLEGARAHPDQRHRRLRQPAAPQAGAGRAALADPHRPGPGLPAGGLSMPLSIRWPLPLWTLSALALVLPGFSALVYALTARALSRQLDDRLLAGLRQLEQDPRLASQREQRLRYWLHELHEHESIFAAAYTS